MGLFGNNKELQFRIDGLMVNLSKVHKNKGENCSFMNLEGAVVNRVHWRKQSLKYGDF